MYEPAVEHRREARQQPLAEERVLGGLALLLHAFVGIPDLLRARDYARVGSLGLLVELGLRQDVAC